MFIIYINSRKISWDTVNTSGCKKNLYKITPFLLLKTIPFLLLKTICTVRHRRLKVKTGIPSFLQWMFFPSIKLKSMFLGKIHIVPITIFLYEKTITATPNNSLCRWVIAEDLLSLFFLTKPVLIKILLFYWTEFHSRPTHVL